MHSLHSGDHAELAEARNVGGVQVLGVLDTPSQVLLVRVLAEDLLIDVEHFAVGAIADSMHAELVSVPDCQFGGLANIGGVFGVQARAVGLVVIGRQQPGAARTEGPIDLPLDGAHGEEIAAGRDHAVLVQIGRQLFVRRPEHHPDAHAQFVIVGHALERIHG